jgi:hypothetical protein
METGSRTTTCAATTGVHISILRNILSNNYLDEATALGEEYCSCVTQSRVEVRHLKSSRVGCWVLYFG